MSLDGITVAVIMFRAAALVIAAACSIAAMVACSDDEANGPDCPIAGTYTLAQIPLSLTCPETDAGGTVQVVSAGDDHYSVKFSGLEGDCKLERTGDCRAYGNCMVTATNESGAELARGPIQYQWEFYPKGFSGTTYFRKDENCVQIGTSVAMRR